MYFYNMKQPAKNKDSRIFRNTVINNDLKKYQDDLIVIKKADKAVEVLRKVKNLNNIL